MRATAYAISRGGRASACDIFDENRNCRKNDTACKELSRSAGRRLTCTMWPGWIRAIQYEKTMWKSQSSPGRSCPGARAAALPAPCGPGGSGHTTTPRIRPAPTPTRAPRAAVTGAYRRHSGTRAVRSELVMHEALLAHDNAEGMRSGRPVLEATEQHGADIGTWLLDEQELNNQRCECSLC